MYSSFVQQLISLKIHWAGCIMNGSYFAGRGQRLPNVKPYKFRLGGTFSSTLTASISKFLKLAGEIDDTKFTDGYGQPHRQNV